MELPRGSRSPRHLGFIAADNEHAADRWLDRIEQVVNKLAANPRLGRLRPEIKDELRSFPVGAYIVFYGHLPDGLHVERVLHSSWDISQQAFD